MRTTAARTPLLLSSGLLVAALVLAGCGGSDNADESASPTPSAGTTAGASPSGSPSGSRNATAAPETSAPSVEGAAPCTADKLSAAVEDTPGGGAAGSVYRDLVLTNTSSEPCSTFGFPGVSYLGISGTQVGAPATRSGGTDAVAVTLAPGQSAVATLRETRPENYGEECSSVSVSGLRIFPPEDTAHLNIARAGYGCSNEEVELLEVGPLTGPR
ncbi:DUF4232 domain-containing protein [Arthrobacter caoxuetaonis]|uniref:DUF4232 domain-containing protein n=1 Tax=Arthrobacter caoxuetaonis TaxID=2886935 RepID=A0A9X1ME49_9MICC|nr:DUF4232 domain-containing protein [Arthrobacter caoxuetaonis]MCC3298359.1 DUF4232 domain-containing protein [Arthrobacter caoxuetaonis]USQ57623.1 DUF4232 domain-containing protein [Arthrobacter caoxuetaonis]